MKVASALKEYRYKRFRFGLFRSALSVTLSGLVAFILFLFLEWNFYFSSEIKTGAVLFFGVVLFCVSVFLLFPPLYSYARGTYFSLSECAREIGQKFPEIDDKLLNAYDLESRENEKNNWWKAAVRERYAWASEFGWTEIFHWRLLLPLVYFVVVPLILLLGYSFFNTSLQEAEQRLWNINRSYQKPPPFAIRWEFSPVVTQGEKAEIKVFLPEGIRIERLLLECNQQKQWATVNAAGEARWLIASSEKENSLHFSVLWNDYRWPEQTIALTKPVRWEGFSCRITPPRYTGVKPYTQWSANPLTVPQGSRLEWAAQIENSGAVRSVGKHKKWTWKKTEGPHFSLTLFAENDFLHEIQAKSEKGEWVSGGLTQVEVIPDEKPRLDVFWEFDSLSGTVKASWTAEDDYGLLEIVIDRSSQPLRGVQSISGRSILPAVKTKEFLTAYAVDSRGQKSSLQTFQRPAFTVYTQQKALAGLARAVAASSKQDRRSAENILAEKERARKESLSRSTETAKTENKKEEIEALERAKIRLKQAEEVVRSLQQPNRENKAQEALWEEKRAELEKLLSEMRKPENAKSLKAATLSLERMEALLERLLIEQATLAAAQALEELSKKQDELANKNEPNEAQAQEEIANTTENLSKEQKSAALDKANAQQKDLTKTKNPGNKEQKEAAESLRDAAQSLRESLLESGTEQAQQDIKSIRQLVDNLVRLSFKSEQLSDAVSKAAQGDPSYPRWLEETQNLISGMGTVQDTLQSLQLRIPQLSVALGDHATEASTALLRSKDALRERKSSVVSMELRRAMKETNDMAVLFQKAAQEAQKKLQGMKKGGTGTCSKPGEGKPSVGALKKKQTGLSQQMMEMGQNPGKGGQGAQEIAQLLAKQEGLRRELEKAGGNKPGARSASDLMKEIERQLTKGIEITRLTETIRRLEIRLLEMEMAEKQQDEDEKRTAETSRGAVMRDGNWTKDIQTYKRTLNKGWPLFKAAYTKP